MPDELPSPAALLRLLADGGVDFVVIGGVAVVLQALPRFTRDLDIVPQPSDENLQRLAGVLLATGARLRGLADDLPFAADVRTLRQADLLTLETDVGALDVLREPPGAPPYAELRERAAVYEIDDVRIPVASIDDLIAMKRTAGRPQDAIDVAALELAKRLARE